MPRLFVFNPGHEEALAHACAPSYTPRREVQRMMLDLPHLMLLLASPNDYVAVPQADGGLVVINHLGQAVAPQELPPLELTPWALERHTMASIYKKATALGLRLTLPPITSAYLSLSHRSSSERLLRCFAHQGWAVGELIPIWIRSSSNAEGELTESLDYFTSMEHRRLMVKRPFSSSGRGVMPLDLPADAACRTLLLGQCRRVGSISLEPWLSIVQDWAVEYYYTPQGVRYVGLSRFDTRDGLGAYQGNRLASEAELRAELIEQIGQERWEQLLSVHTSFLKSELGSDYEGYVGVDMCLYQKEGKLRLHPAVELNVRCTMGVLAHEAYLRHVASLYPKPKHTQAMGQGRQGLAERYTFRLDYFASSGEALALYQDHRASTEARPPIPLTCPTTSSHYYAYLLGDKDRL